MFVGGNEIFNVEKSIGSGAFAKVFLAKKFGDNDDNDFETDDESSVVLKVGCLFQVDQNISSEKIFWWFLCPFEGVLCPLRVSRRLF